MEDLHYERIDWHSQFTGVYTKDYKVGDKITWLGHENVHGYSYGEEYICSQEHFDLRGDHPVYKKIGEIHMSRIDYNGKLIPLKEEPNIIKRFLDNIKRNELCKTR